MPAWLALTVQLPVLAKLSWLPVMLHTPVALNVTGWPDAPPVAASVGVVPKACVPGLAKLMVCVSCSMTAALVPGGLSPKRLVALTVKVYSSALGSPVMVQGDAVHLT